MIMESQWEEWSRKLNGQMFKYSYLDYDNNKKADYKSNNGRLQNWPQIFSIPVCASLCKITLQQLLSRGKMNFSNHWVFGMWYPLVNSTIRPIRDSEMAFIERLLTLVALENLKLYVKQSGPASWMMRDIFPSHLIALSVISHICE